LLLILLLQHTISLYSAFLLVFTKKRFLFFSGRKKVFRVSVFVVTGEESGQGGENEDVMAREQTLALHWEHAHIIITAAFDLEL
jgi:hypothetical protein